MTVSLPDLNTMDLAALTAIVGASRAEAIVAARTQSGGFASWLDAGRARGVGVATLRRLAAHTALVPSAAGLDGDAATASATVLRVTNPGSGIARVRVALRRDGGGAASFAPIRRTIGAGATVEIDLGGAIVTPDAFSVILRSDAPVEAWLGEVQLAAPRVMGEVPAGVVVLLNPQAQTVTLRVSALALQLQPGQRRTLRLAGSATVEADAPIGLWPCARSAQAGTLLVGRGGRGAADRRVDLSNASQEQLAALPGVSPRIAESIRVQRDQGRLHDVIDLLDVAGIGEALLSEIQGLIKVEGREKAGIEPDPPGTPLILDAGEHIDPRTAAFSLREVDLVIEGRAGMSLPLARIYQPRRAGSPWPRDGLPPGWGLDLPRVVDGVLLISGVSLKIPKDDLCFEPNGLPLQLTALRDDEGAPAGWTLFDGRRIWALDADGRPTTVWDTYGQNAIELRWDADRLVQIQVATDDVVTLHWLGSRLMLIHYARVERRVAYQTDETAHGEVLLSARVVGRTTRYQWRWADGMPLLTRITNHADAVTELEWREAAATPSLRARRWITCPIGGERHTIRDERWTIEAGPETSRTRVERGPITLGWTFSRVERPDGARWDLDTDGLWSGAPSTLDPEEAVRLRAIVRESVHGHPTSIRHYRRGTLARCVEYSYAGPEARLGLPTAVRETDALDAELRVSTTTFGGPLPGQPTFIRGEVDVRCVYGQPEGDASGLRLTAWIEDPDGLHLETRLRWDQHGNLLRTILPDGSSEQGTWGPRGALDSVILTDWTIMGGDGQRHTWTYEVVANRRRSTDPDGFVEILEFDAQQRVVLRQSEDTTTTWTWDDAEDTVTISSNGLADTVAIGAGHGDPVIEILQTSTPRIWSRLPLDALGRPTSLQAPGRGPLALSWDALSRLSGERTSDGVELTWTWDDQMMPFSTGAGAILADRLVMVQPGAPQRELFTDALDRVVAFRETRGDDVRVWSWTWDTRGRLVEERDPVGVTVVHHYDGAGRRVESVAEDGRCTRWVFDALGRMVAETDGDGVTTRWTYDGLGRPATETRPNGIRHEQRWTASGEPERGVWTQRRIPGGWELHEPDGTWTRITERLLGATRHVEQLRSNGERDVMAYDEAGALVAYERGGRRLDFQRDEAGRIRGIDDGIERFGFRFDDASGALRGLSTVVGELTLSHSSHSTVATADRQSSGLTSDAWGEPEAIGSESGTERLMRETKPDFHASWLKDAGGRWSGVSTVPSERLLTVWPRSGVEFLDHQLTPGGRVASTTNPMGEQTRYEYDEAGQLARRIEPDGQIIHFAHDGDGQVSRVERGALVTRYERDATGEIIAVWLNDTLCQWFERDARGRVIRQGSSEDREDGVVMSWDDQDRLTGRYMPDGASEVIRYDDNNRTLTVTGSDGRSVRLAQDAEGRPVSMACDEAQPTTWDWSTPGQVRVRQSTGAAFDARLDPAGNVVSFDSVWGPIEIGWTPGGDVAQLSSQLGTWQMRYDDQLRLNGLIRVPRDPIEPVDPPQAEGDAPPPPLVYDGAGRVIEANGGAGLSYRVVRDAASRSVRWEAPNGERLIEASAQDELCWTLSGPDNTLTTTVDVATRTFHAKLDGPSPSQVSRRLDAQGRLIELVVEGLSIRYRRDGAGRITRVELEDLAVDMTWDERGYLTRRQLNENCYEARFYIDGKGVQQLTADIYHYQIGIKDPRDVFHTPPTSVVFREGQYQIQWYTTNHKTGARDAHYDPLRLTTSATVCPPVLRTFAVAQDDAMFVSWMAPGGHTLTTPDGVKPEDLVWVRPPPAERSATQVQTRRASVSDNVVTETFTWESVQDGVLTPYEDTLTYRFDPTGRIDRVEWHDGYFFEQFEGKYGDYDRRILTLGEDASGGLVARFEAPLGMLTAFEEWCGVQQRDAAGRPARLYMEHVGNAEHGANHVSVDATLVWDALGRLARIGYGKNTEPLTRDPHGRLVAKGQTRYVRDGDAVLLCDVPFKDTGDRNRTWFVPDDDGRPLLAYRPADGNRPRKVFLLVTHPDGSIREWVDERGYVHSANLARNLGAPSGRAPNSAGQYDASGQGPGEDPSMRSMFDPFGAHGGLEIAQGIVEIGGRIWCTTLRRFLDERPEEDVAALLAAGPQALGTRRAPVLLWSAPLPRPEGGQRFRPAWPLLRDPLPISYLPAPSWSEVAWGLGATLGISTLSALAIGFSFGFGGVLGGVALTGALLGFSAQSSWSSRQEEWRERYGHGLGACSALALVAGDLTGILSWVTILTGRDPIHGDNYLLGHRVFLALTEAAGALGGRLGTKTGTLHGQLQKFRLVGDEITSKDARIIIEESTLVHGGVLGGRTIRTTYSRLRDMDAWESSYFARLDKLHKDRGPRAPNRMVEQWTVTPSGQHEKVKLGMLSWDVHDALRFYLAGTSQATLPEASIWTQLASLYRTGDWKDTRAAKVWWRSKHTEACQLYANYVKNGKLTDTRRPPPYDHAEGKLPDDVDIAVNLYEPLGGPRFKAMATRINERLGFEFVDTGAAHMVLPKHFDLRVPAKGWWTRLWSKRMHKFLERERLHEPGWSPDTHVVTEWHFARYAPIFGKPKMGDDGKIHYSLVTKRVPQPFAPDLAIPPKLVPTLLGLSLVRRWER